jgi:hypothetical protein
MMKPMKSLIECPKDFLSEQFFAAESGAVALPLIVELFLERRNDLLKERLNVLKKFRQSPEVLNAFPFGSDQVRKAPWEGKSSSRSLSQSPKLFLDLEDGLAPHWNLRLNALSEENLSSHQWLKPRGIHLDERNLSVHGRYLPATFFDLYFALAKRSKREDWVGVIIPKLESPAEARFWSDLLFWLEDFFGLKRSSIEVCVEFETVTGCLEAEEILFELKDRTTTMAFDPFDYGFSWLRFFGAQPENLFFQSERNELYVWTRPLLTYLSDLAERRAFSFQTTLETLHSLPKPLLLTAPQGTSVPNVEEVQRISVKCLNFLASYLRGENRFDLAEFEFIRSLLWQWVRFQIPISETEKLTADRYLADQKNAQIVGEREGAEVRLFHSFLLKESLLDYSVPYLFKHLQSI